MLVKQLVINSKMGWIIIHRGAEVTDVDNTLESIGIAFLFQMRTITATKHWSYDTK